MPCCLKTNKTSMDFELGQICVQILSLQLTDSVTLGKTIERAVIRMLNANGMLFLNFLIE